MRTICVVATNRSDYGRLHPVMDALRAHPDITLQVVYGSYAYFDSFWQYLRYAKPESLLRSLPWYIRARLTKLVGGEGAVFAREQLSRMMMADGFTITARLPLLFEGGTTQEMVAAAGVGLLSLRETFARLKPDVVLINGDRFEILPVAVAAAYMNIPIAHIEGGDVSGTIDNSIRHAVSKFSHLHFPATQESADRLVRMGEHPDTIYTFGSPIIDSLTKIDTSLDNTLFDRYPSDVGCIDLIKPYILIAHHPVTTEYADNHAQMKELLAALDTLGMPQFFVSPNIDAGSDGISVAMREYRLGPASSRSVFHKHLSLEDYIKVYAHACVAVGNSSSFLREGAFLGVPSVIVGTRQQHRERGANVVEVEAKKDTILTALKTQIAHGPYEKDLRFGDGTSAEKIAKTLLEVDLDTLGVQKYFWEK